MSGWLPLLHGANWVLGSTVVGYGIIRWITEDAVVPLLVALAIIIAGPLEDLLITCVKQICRDETQCQTLMHTIDLCTSLGFLICLGLAVCLS